MSDACGANRDTSDACGANRDVMSGQITLAELPVGEGRTIVVGDQQVAVFRLRDGSVRALSARCPHLGGPLADGLIDNKVVICPLHGRVYDLLTGAEAAGDTPVMVWDVSVAADGTIEVDVPMSASDAIST
jgi:nitrite reductase (NADH) small subunit